VSVQIIFLAESAKPGAVNRATANIPKMADFICGKYARLDALSNRCLLIGAQPEPVRVETS
jgi:hypothetical protein